VFDAGVFVMASSSISELSVRLCVSLVVVDCSGRTRRVRFFMDLDLSVTEAIFYDGLLKWGEDF
jgi:hypothetical protein